MKLNESWSEFYKNGIVFGLKRQIIMSKKNFRLIMHDKSNVIKLQLCLVNCR